MRIHGNYLLTTLLALGLAVSGEAMGQAQPASAASPANTAPWQGPKLRLVVADLNSTALKNPPPAGPSGTDNIPPPTEFGRGLTEMLTAALVKSERFVVLERVTMDKVTAEQDLSAGPRANAATAAQPGKILGAQAIITGDITEFSYSSSGYDASLLGLRGLGSKLGKRKVTAKVVIDLRIVDAATGQVLTAQRAQGKATMSNASAGLVKGRQDFTAATEHDTPLGEATRQALEGAVNAIVAGMKAAPWSAHVIDVRDGVVYINAGGATGIQMGVELEVYHPGEPLLDPDTGQSLGSPDTRVGSVVVEAVQDSYSTAKVNSGTGMQRGDVVRLKSFQR